MFALKGKKVFSNEILKTVKEGNPTNKFYTLKYEY